MATRAHPLAVKLVIASKLFHRRETAELEWSFGEVHDERDQQLTVSSNP
jgi:hypothetical protein